jgi:hypothetical protein
VTLAGVHPGVTLAGVRDSTENEPVLAPRTKAGSSSCLPGGPEALLPIDLLDRVHAPSRESGPRLDVNAKSLFGRKPQSDAGSIPAASTNFINVT